MKSFLTGAMDEAGGSSGFIETVMLDSWFAGNSPGRLREQNGEELIGVQWQIKRIQNKQRAALQ
jgi:hypothetical protein